MSRSGEQYYSKNKNRLTKSLISKIIHGTSPQSGLPFKPQLNKIGLTPCVCIPYFGTSSRLRKSYRNLNPRTLRRGPSLIDQLLLLQNIAFRQNRSSGNRATHNLLFKIRFLLSLKTHPTRECGSAEKEKLNT